jgi:TetR/AcrR family transcriptional repressor of nem operon
MNDRTEQKEQTRADILRSADRLVRARGIAGASVAAVMKGARLTVGGFYAHFRSKDALIEDVLRRAVRGMRDRFVAPLADRTTAERIEAVLRRYLTVLHRDHPAEGCALPATLAELAQEGAPLRRALADELEDFVTALAGPGAGARRRQLALGALALMVGGLALSRATKGSPLSESVLESCIQFGRAALKESDQ